MRNEKVGLFDRVEIGGETRTFYFFTDMCRNCSNCVSVTDNHYQWDIIDYHLSVLFYI